MSLETILESYVNGQIKQAKSQLAESNYTFSELFEYYADTHLMSDWLYELKLFVQRMTD